MICTGLDGPSAAPAISAISHHFTSWISPIGGVPDGGDWCNILRLPNNIFAITIGDVSGHGESVAHSMVAMRTAVLHAMQHVLRPSEILSIANTVASRKTEHIIVTAIVAFVDLRRNTMTFSNAGHPPPLLVSRDHHAFLEQSPSDLPLGVVYDYKAKDSVVQLPDDGLLVLYTDGITEHDKRPLSGETELIDAAFMTLASATLHAAGAVAHSVLARIRGNDDAATLCLRILPTERESPQTKNRVRAVRLRRARRACAAYAQ